MLPRPIIAADMVPDSPSRRGWLRVLRVGGWATVGMAAGLMAWRLGIDPLVRRLSPHHFDVASLTLAGVICGVSQLLHCSRWYWFLRVSHASFTWTEAMFTGLAAQLLGAIAIGSAGGDIYRGVVAGSGKAGHRVGIVASILADRVAGVYSLFCVAAIAATFTPGGSQWEMMRAASMPVLWTAVVAGGAGILAALFLNLGPALAWSRSIPLLFRLVAPLLAAVERFRSTPVIFALGIASGMAVHAANAAALWLVARGLAVPHPTLAEHCLIAPLATCTALLPLPMAGLGAVELVIDKLYQTAVPAAAGAGLVAAFGGRVLGLAVNALLAAIFLPLSRVSRSEPRIEA